MPFVKTIPVKAVRDQSATSSGEGQSVFPVLSDLSSLRVLVGIIDRSLHSARTLLAYLSPLLARSVLVPTPLSDASEGSRDRAKRSLAVKSLIPLPPSLWSLPFPISSPKRLSSLFSCLSIADARPSTSARLSRPRPCRARASRRRWRADPTSITASVFRPDDDAAAAVVVTGGRNSARLSGSHRHRKNLATRSSCGGISSLPPFADEDDALPPPVPAAAPEAFSVSAQLCCRNTAR
mmetsp:Transcript_31147/g.69015  ORF Transcript_31147/g.69015 Transcript_31147/m.69015 type:complete len:237 (-) Transcript_31147:261-971(-)